MAPVLSFLQISVPGTLGTAILPGLMKHVEYEITILAYYRDGTRSDPVSLRYTPCRWSITYIQTVLGQEQDRGDSGLPWSTYTLRTSYSQTQVKQAT